MPNLVSGTEAPLPLDAVDQASIDSQNTGNYTVAEDTWSYGGYAVIDFDGDSASIQFFTDLREPIRMGRSASPTPSPATPSPASRSPSSFR